jgi:glyoxylase-like metal-dependent hydrolase (beta-lactamase superfamily II)
LVLASGSVKPPVGSDCQVPVGSTVAVAVDSVHSRWNRASVADDAALRRAAAESGRRSSEPAEATGAPVYMHPEDAEAAGVGGYEPLQDGEGIALAGQRLGVVHTPGHSPGSVTFVVDKDQIVGDLVLPGSVGRTDISRASWEEIEVSLRKVMPYWEDETRLYTGHGPILFAMEELKTNPYLPPVIP